MTLNNYHFSPWPGRGASPKKQEQLPLIKFIPKLLCVSVIELQMLIRNTFLRSLITVKFLDNQIIFTKVRARTCRQTDITNIFQLQYPKYYLHTQIILHK